MELPKVRNFTHKDACQFDFQFILVVSCFISKEEEEKQNLITCPCMGIAVACATDRLTTCSLA